MSWQGMQLTLVQSTICVLAVVCIVVLKWIGGDVYAVLATQFQRAMTEESLVSVMVPQETVAAEELPLSVPVALIQNVESEEATAKSVCAPLTDGVITSPFGEREDPFDATQQRTHHGVDIGADEGQTLNALYDGTVSEVGYEEDGYGHYVIVSCDETYSYLYAHCSRVDVQEGQSVKAGDAIALVGSTGRSTGSHLHFEWLEDGEAVDPMTVLPEETYA